MEMALKGFGLQEADIDDYVMTTVLVDKAVIDCKLALDERPFHLIQELDKVREVNEFEWPTQAYCVTPFDLETRDQFVTGNDSRSATLSREITSRSIVLDPKYFCKGKNLISFIFSVDLIQLLHHPHQERIGRIILLLYFTVGL